MANKQISFEALIAVGNEPEHEEAIQLSDDELDALEYLNWVVTDKIVSFSNQHLTPQQRDVLFSKAFVKVCYPQASGKLFPLKDKWCSSSSVN